MERYTATSVRQLKNGSWQARLRYKDENGKWKNLDKVLKGVKGKREAQRAAENLRRELNAVLDEPEKTGETVEDAVRSYIDYQLATNQIEQSTHYYQEKTIEKRIAPYIGDYFFDTLDRTAIMDWHTKLSADGISQSTIKRIMAIVDKTYNYYVLIGKIKANPFNQVKKPQRSKARVSHMTDQQIEKFLAAVYSEYDIGDPILTGILMCYYAGLRVAEACGCRWRDIDFTAHTIDINTSIGRKEGGFYTKPPKTPSSIRKFPIVSQLEEVLYARYIRIHPEPNWFVIGDGTDFMNQVRLERAFRNFVRAYELVDAYDRPLVLHALRHQFAFTGVKAGIDISTLAAMLGHGDQSLTLNTYSDSSEESKVVGAKRLTDAFKKTDLDT